VPRQRNQQRERQRPDRGEQQPPHTPDPADDRPRHERPQQPAEPGQRREQSRHARRHPDHADEEDDDQRGKPVEREVRQPDEDRQRPKIRIAEHKGHAIGHVPPQRRPPPSTRTFRRPRLRRLDHHEADRRHQEAHGVERQRRRRPDALSHHPRQPPSPEGRRRGAGLQLRIPLGELVGRDQRCQIHLVRRAENDRRRTRQQLNDEQLPNAQHPERVRHRHTRIQRGRRDVARDHQRPRPQPIHPRTGGQPDEQPRQIPRRGQGTDLERRGVQIQDSQQRHPDQRHGAADLVDRLPDPEQPEIPLPQQPAEPPPPSGHRPPPPPVTRSPPVPAPSKLPVAPGPKAAFCCQQKRQSATHHVAHRLLRLLSGCSLSSLYAKERGVTVGVHNGPRGAGYDR
jgi:hypothetical protein